MRLVTHGDRYAECLALHNTSFAGVERAPEGVFKQQYWNSEVFIRTAWDGCVNAFAMVSFKLNTPYVWAIAVEEKERGKGFGKSLLEEIDVWARGAGYTTIELTVKATNPAQKLYFDAGYRVVSVLRRFYLNDGDGLLMRRVL